MTRTFPLLALLFALTSCEPAPVRHPEIDEWSQKTLETWQEVWVAPRTGAERTPVLAGYLAERRRPGEEPVTFVHDPYFRELGYITAAGRTYRLDTNSGKRDAAPQAEEISEDGLERGVLLLLGERGKAIELRPLSTNR
ncbi:MAG TPA: hypothetical protein VK116_10535 [Planctomycetota bacterium]|nr:hypothetical protein [Planctomycetota bacterium]